LASGVKRRRQQWAEADPGSMAFEPFKKMSPPWFDRGDAS
jgi:hypothetical protein